MSTSDRSPHSTTIDYFLTLLMEKLVVNIILGVKVLFVNRFSIFYSHFTIFGKQKDDMSTLFSGGVSVKFLE